MLLVTHLLGGQLRIYRLCVDFPQSRLRIQQLQIIDDYISVQPDDPLSVHESLQAQLTGPLNPNADRLYMLAALPARPATPKYPAAPACVLVVFFREPNRSVISKWEFSTVSAELHPIFASLTTKITGGQAENKVFLVHFHIIILVVQC